MQKIAIIMENDNGDMFGYTNSQDLDNKIDCETAFAPHVTSFPEAIKFCEGHDASIFFFIAERWIWMQNCGRGTSARWHAARHRDNRIGKVYGSLKPFVQPNDIEAHEIR